MIDKDFEGGRISHSYSQMWA